DARYFTDEDTGTDTFLIRRARIDVRGKINNTFSFRILPEFGDGKNGELLDAYLDWKTSESAALRIGKFKSSIGLERVQSGSRLLFLER
ncbi:porin, partial [Streptomyces brasiliscabiei]|uniref:porin n=1 Tax=Streptomyces brasiliscabiei TaxID=2736302 RepID=UPI0038F7F078